MKKIISKIIFNDLITLHINANNREYFKRLFNYNIIDSMSYTIAGLRTYLF